MKKYHVKTRHDYQDLMKHLEEEGKKWCEGDRPSAFDGWSKYKENTVILVQDNGLIWFGSFDIYADEGVIEYVASIEKVETNKTTQPSYYHNGNIDVIKFGEENFAKDEIKGFYRMNVLKYVTRFDKKGSALTDLEKASFYLNKLKEITEEEN